ncbi:outer membrane protein assembly factor BamA [Shimia biformata]|uniref:outer membrane protein assembly factor BamA n=1 Tax=Shimia biformata TaxID=1294299 RepID=UPI00194DB2EB|nr:outer membrane protein assembly factor BamA [Shimia biformata]
MRKAQARAATVDATGFRKLLVAFFFLVSIFLLLLPSLAEAQDYRFSSVAVEGNRRIESTAILTYAGIARNQPVTGGQLNAAYQRVLATGLFEEVELVPNGSQLIIRVKEYPTINIINFEGNKRLKDENLGQVIESQSRRVLNPSAVERDAARIAEAYAQSGRLAARVTPRIIRRPDNRADLVFEIFEGDVVEIERISFVGNQHFSDYRLRQVLGTKQAGLLREFIRRDTFVEDRVEFDKQVLRDFYLSRGYIDFRTTSVSAELSQERDGYFLAFNVEEGQQFKFGKITILSEVKGLDAAEFEKAQKIRSGRTYTPLDVENNIARMETLAVRLGYDFIRVDPRITRNDRDLTLDVEFALVKGDRIFVERIDIEGNTTTLDRVVRTQFRIVEGDPFNAREVRESAERIRALGFFSTANVNAREGSAPDQVVIDVDVEEQPTGSLSFGGTYSTNDGLGLVMRFSERNFLGRGQNLAVNLSTSSEIADYFFGFSDPNILGRDLEAGIVLRYQETSRSINRFTQTIGEFRPSLSFPVSQNGRLSLNYRLQNIAMEIREDEEIPTSIIDTEAALGDVFQSSIGYTYTWDSRRNGIDPKTGYNFELSQNFGGIGGDYQYINTEAKLSAVTRVLQENVTLRASLEGGMHYSPDKDSRITDRFILPPRQMRGFTVYGIGPRETGITADQNDALGGTMYAVARFEAEFPLGLPEEVGITGGLFYDVGSLWGVDRTGVGTVQGADFSLRHVVGLSIFWNTPIGPLRFNFSKALKKEDFDEEQFFDFTIRAEF